MKKGFTLVELLGTITILGVIMLIVSPIARNIISDSKEELYEVQVSNIEDALKNWVVDNSRLLPENEGETITITLGQLKAGGYVETELRNPKNNKCFGNDMLLTVTRHQKNYIYNVEDESSTETTTCDEYLKPYIILNGDAIVYLEVGEGEYVDLGASAIGTDGADISPNITTSISGSGDTIDTSVVGNSYTITYTIVEGFNTTSIKRKVIVSDTTPPELTIPDNVTLEKKDTSFNIIEGVSATDNSDSSGSSVNITAKSNISFGIPGEYTITYMAIDSSGNKTTKKRVVNIKKAYGNAILSSDDKCVLKGNECEAGTLVEVYVNDSTKYNFYVINDDTNELTLIMDRNLYSSTDANKGNVMWISRIDYNLANSEDGDNTPCGFISCNDEGPLTAISYLKERTETWDNIVEKNYVYSDSEKKYVSFSVLARARLPMFDELYSIMQESEGNLPKYLLKNLNNTGDNNTNGYWTSTTSNLGTNCVWTVQYDGVLYNDAWISMENSTRGIRPVITLSK